MTRDTMNSDNEQAFCVVQFIELPFEDIDDYVCVPYTWVVIRKATNDKAAVAYPKDEDPFDTRDRAKRKERYNDEWRLYMATIKYESNSYNDAEFWIATRNDYGPLVEEKSRVTDTQPKFSINKKLRSANKNHSSGSNDNFRKPLPGVSIKRPAKLESKKKVDEKRLKLGESAQSAVVNDAKVEPRSPKRKQSVIIQDNQSMESSHAEESSVVSNADESTEPRSKTLRTDQTEQDVPQNFTHIEKPHIENVRSLANIDVHKLLVNEISSQKQSSIYEGLDSHKISAHLYSHMNGGRRLVPIQKPVEKTIRPTNSVTSDSDSVTDQEIISDHEMSTDEAPAEITNNVHSTANDPGHGSADRPAAAQNSTANSHQMNPKFVLEQQMLNNFATLFTQMGSTLRHTTDMYNTLRSSILDTAKTYKKLLGAVEQFNTAGNATNNASSSSNPIPDVPQPSEERHTTIIASARSSNQDQHSNDVANKTPKKKHKKLFRFVLPPEYDAYDSRWTLKYRTYLEGLVELVPESHVYVSYGDLKYCQQVSKDCPSLARRLLPEVFNRNALSVCSSMSETAKASNSVGSNIRPDLDDHACSVLLNFVLEHGFQRGWNTDLKPILSMLHSKMQEIRFKYGIMVEC